MAATARFAVPAGSALAVALALHTIANIRLLRVPPPTAPVGALGETGETRAAGAAGAAGETRETRKTRKTRKAGETRETRKTRKAGDAGELVSVLLPVRDEADRVGACLAALLASTGMPRMEVVVYDDASTDATAAIVARVAGRDPRVRLLRGGAMPAGWLGKPHACAEAAAAARGSVLVFVDADVRLAPDGLARTVGLLRASGLDLVCPYPRQDAVTIAERLVQPLLQWSWLALLPLRAAERSPRPSLAAANGQLLCVDAHAYRAMGGHGARAVRASVLDDVDLLRTLKRVGGRGVVADGTDVAVVRMYDGWAALRDGYAKSLWAAGGSAAGSAGQVALLGWVYVLPALAAFAGSPAGFLGYLAGVVSRVAAARATGGRAWPDALAHPASIMLLGYLTGLSWWRRCRGSATWKGRPLAPHAREGI